VIIQINSYYMSLIRMNDGNVVLKTQPPSGNIELIITQYSPIEQFNNFSFLFNGIQRRQIINEANRKVSEQINANKDFQMTPSELSESVLKALKAHNYYRSFHNNANNLISDNKLNQLARQWSDYLAYEYNDHNSMKFTNQDTNQASINGQSIGETTFVHCVNGTVMMKNRQKSKFDAYPFLNHIQDM
jgi:hypothetical protein